MGGGVSVAQCANDCTDAIATNRKEILLKSNVVAEKHWKDELKLYKLDSIITMLENLGCRTNDDVIGLPNHIWNEIQLKLKLLDQNRLNKLRVKYSAEQQKINLEAAIPDPVLSSITSNV